MMVPDDREHPAQCPERPADLLAGDGMLLHDLPFGRSKLRSLLQHMIGDGDLTEIMQDPTATERDDIFLGIAEMTAKIRSIMRKSVAMAFGIRIACFYALRQRA